MRYARLVPIAAAVILVLNLLAVSGADVSAAQGGTDLCVAISGGTVQNATVLDVAANGGTGIGDASGGNGNLAVAADGGNGNNNNNNNHHHNNNHHNWTSESLPAFEQRLLQTDTASSGNGGVATVAANGGAVSIQDVNSGGNAGNAISVGDTHCPGAVKSTSGGGGGGGKAPSGNVSTGGGGGGKVRALPSTGVGEPGAGSSGSLMLALGALGMMGLSIGSRLNRGAVQIGRR